MPINESIWGPQTQWTQSNFDNNAAYTFRGALGAYVTHNWGDYLNSELPVNQLIDNSVSFCGLLEDKYNFYKAHAIVFHEDESVSALYSTESSYNLIWLINPFWRYGNGMGGTIDFLGSQLDRWSEWETASSFMQADGHFGFQCTPIFKQKLNKILAIPYVTVSTTNGISASTTEMLLGDWISTGHTNYPYLNRCFIQLASCANPGSSDWTSFLFSTDYYMDIVINSECSTVIKSKSILKSSYGFYASANRKQQITIAGLQEAQMTIDSRNNPIGCDPDITHYIFNNEKTIVRYSREYSEELIEELYHQIAFYGVFFVGKGSVTYNTRCSLSDSRIFCGTIDENGYTHGDYTEGVDNLDQPQYSWEDTDDSNYDPYTPLPQGDEYTAKGIRLNVNAHPHGGYYYFSDQASSFTTLLNEINNIIVPDGGWQESNQFYGQEPLSCIIESRLLFINNPYTDNTSAVQLGAFTSEDVSLPLKLSTEVQEYKYQPIYVKPLYNDFRDYAPYTSVLLWFPFCGAIELDTNIVMGHNIYLVENIDPITGDIKVIVKVDASEYYTMTGNCACDLSVSGFNMSQYAQTRLSLQMQQIGSQFNAAASLIGGLSGGSIAASLKNPTGATLQMLGGAINYGGSLYQARQYKNLNFKMKPSVGRADKAAGNVEEGAVYLPMIIVTRPRILPEYEASLEGYVAQNGIATHTIGKIGDQSGFVQCENPHVDVTATPEEQAQIAQLLESGIRIK